MTPEDFVVRFLRLVEEKNYNESTVECIARAADTTRDGLISFDEFVAFEAILCTPDAPYVLAFEIFDRKGQGYLDFEDFQNVIKLTTPYASVPFDFNCDFVTLHFGRDKSRKITYADFTQIIHTVLHGEKHGEITFAYYMGFINLLSNMELAKKIYRVRTQGNLTAVLTKDEFLNEAQHFAQITPMEIDILFNLASMMRGDGRIGHKELVAISPIKDGVLSYHNYASGLHDTVQRKVEDRGRTVFLSMLEQCYRFTLGSVAGAMGATAVYPIDLVKTRMQNQRTGSAIGELLYKNSWDCFRKVIRFEGFSGLYRGLGPQLIGVAPEKAIKLTVNDLVRDQFTSTDGGIHLAAEILAGSCAGASQVVFTNPLEIVKIRLQVAGEIASTQRTSAISVIRELGLLGLYKGARACFLRDIPFSAIYFTAYSHLKTAFANEDGINTPGTLLAAATLSGAPSACLTTPADVIKTRLQVVARAGQSTYTGIMDAARKIWREEGGRAFWKGAGARVFRSSPQFGVTLLTYEMLQRLLYIDFGGRELAGAGLEHRHESTSPIPPDHIGGLRFATDTFTGIETKLGLCFPKFKIA
ncbi:Solute carrier family 25 (Mitochondrial carrier Aralar) member 12 [Fasciolopsis buskii]|uniref:Solute carrier family 25 (Mitochondrial carrier Aralar) member 12 n=1 Tax=Fasciolopsis buskii TaxID=27845 RepID=A0A8E0VRA7_9TREM|nr:Solute carrier family 25 (Mitochondrial carrier Aralar) member 12 [Fasciolopsis buski]